MVVWTVKDDDGEIGYVVAFANNYLKHHSIVWINSLQTANFQYECLSHRDEFDSVERAAPKSPKQAMKEENSAKMCVRFRFPSFADSTIPAQKKKRREEPVQARKTPNKPPTDNAINALSDM